MKNRILIISLVIILVVITSIGGYFWFQLNLIKQNEAEIIAVKDVVEGFGKVLKDVSLLSPTAAQDIEENYKNFLDPILLEQWKADPSKAVGRLTSSPWPDEIIIANIRQFGSGAYDVSGKIIDITSKGMAGSRPFEIGVAKFDDRWLITRISILPFNEKEIWKDYNNDGISFQYPEILPTEYIYTQEWPPMVETQSEVYACSETSQGDSSLTEIIAQRVINSRIYCINVKHEGAAGSVYSSYVYTTPKNGKLVSISFTLRYSSCRNYYKDDSDVCLSEREAFNLDELVDNIFQTIKLDLSENDNNLAIQLALCLVKSDSASHEKCNKLLEQITDFNSCAMAGFSIMKSNPSQCVTPDGRTFTQEMNSI